MKIKINVRWNDVSCLVTRVTENPQEANVSQPCNHERTVTDPESGETFCQNCGLLLLESPRTVGIRLVYPKEWLHRATIRLQELDREKHQLLSVVAKVQGTRCRWQDCQAPPILRSRWCPLHHQEHAKDLDKMRQRRHRQKTTALGNFCHDVTHEKPILVRKEEVGVVGTNQNPRVQITCRTCGRDATVPSQPEPVPSICENCQNESPRQPGPFTS